MVGRDPKAELAPRDVVVRAMMAEMRREGTDHVFLDATHLDAGMLHERFPTVSARPGRARLRPGARPHPGGARCATTSSAACITDVWGRTTVPGLYASGEVRQHRRARRQPPGLQLAARGPGVLATAWCATSTATSVAWAKTCGACASSCPSRARRRAEGSDVGAVRARLTQRHVGRRSAWCAAATICRRRSTSCASMYSDLRLGGEGPARVRAAEPAHRRHAASPSARCSARRRAACTCARTSPSATTSTGGGTAACACRPTDEARGDGGERAGRSRRRARQRPGAGGGGRARRARGRWTKTSPATATSPGAPSPAAVAAASWRASPACSRGIAPFAGGGRARRRRRSTSLCCAATAIAFAAGDTLAVLERRAGRHPRPRAHRPQLPLRGSRAWRRSRPPTSPRRPARGRASRPRARRRPDCASSRRQPSCTAAACRTASACSTPP